MEDINTLTQKANSGDAVAMRKLGYEYLIGKQHPKRRKKGISTFPCSCLGRRSECDNILWLLL